MGRFRHIDMSRSRAREEQRIDLLRQDIVLLYARALLRMEGLGWSEDIAYDRKLEVARKPYKRHIFSRTRYRSVLLRTSGVNMSPFYLMRNGQVYYKDPIAPEGESREFDPRPSCVLVTDLTQLKPSQLQLLASGFEHILACQPVTSE